MCEATQSGTTPNDSDVTDLAKTGQGEGGKKPTAHRQKKWIQRSEGPAARVGKVENLSVRSWGLPQHSPPSEGRLLSSCILPPSFPPVESVGGMIASFSV